MRHAFWRKIIKNRYISGERPYVLWYVRRIDCLPSGFVRIFLWDALKEFCVGSGGVLSTTYQTEANPQGEKIDGARPPFVWPIGSWTFLLIFALINGLINYICISSWGYRQYSGHSAAKKEHFFLVLPVRTLVFFTECHRLTTTLWHLPKSHVNWF